MLRLQIAYAWLGLAIMVLTAAYHAATLSVFMIHAAPAAVFKGDN